MNNFSSEKILDTNFNNNPDYKVLGNFENPDFNVENTENQRFKSNNGKTLYQKNSYNTLDNQEDNEILALERQNSIES